jgi:enamine deaminase RidA (YjgF/YER057c/UK114 family)
LKCRDAALPKKGVWNFEVFGDDAGVGARSAVGMGSLPSNIPAEIECILEVS